eukprot:15290398-Alexandrium_andersonii.AAC.1
MESGASRGSGDVRILGLSSAMFMRKPISSSMSSVLASGSSCSPMSDICSLASAARTFIPADPTPTHAGPGRLS